MVPLKYFLFIFCCLIASSVFGQREIFPSPKISASTQLFLWKLSQDKKAEKGIYPENSYRLDEQNKVYVNSFIKVFPGFQEENLRTLGVKVGTKAGNIWTTQIPIQEVQNFIKTPGIQYIDLDQATAPDLDSARRRTRADSAQQGYSLPQSYTGKGVVMGIIDAGFDYSHPTFYDTSYTRYRVKKVWEQKTIGTPPVGFGYGAEYADSASILTRARDIEDGTHGTHVGGIAGGSGQLGPNGNNRRFRGLAYESDLIFTAIYPTAAYWLNTGMVDMLDGINYTFQYGASQGKPAVANLSWGCPLGPRDGSSLFSQALDNLVGPGKIFVLSGGNNGQNRIHLKKTFTPSDTIVHTFVTFPSNLPQKVNQVDIWGDTAQSFCVQFSLYAGTNRTTESGWVCLDNSVHPIFLIGANGDTCFITASTIAEEFNLKPHILIQLRSRVNETLCFSVKGQNGNVNLWQGIVVKTSGYYGTFSRNGQTWATDGNFQMTTGDMVSSRRAIAVGAYNSKVSFTNVSGQALSYTGYQRGRISAFSSMGPTADGRVKPDITAPGLALASGVSSYDSSYSTGGNNYDAVVSKSVSTQNGRTYSYGMAGGTSMAAPTTSGIVAMLLQVNPELSPEMVMNAFAQTAITDQYTAVIPPGGNNVWGFGKVNAMGSLRQMLNPTGIRHSRVARSILLFPNPGQGCFSIENVNPPLIVEEVMIIDGLGRKIKELPRESLNPQHLINIDLSENPNGIYWVRVKTNTGIEVVQLIKRL